MNVDAYLRGEMALGWGEQVDTQVSKGLASWRTIRVFRVESQRPRVDRNQNGSLLFLG